VAEVLEEVVSQPSSRLKMLKYEVIWGHIDILVVVVRRLSRRWKVKTLLAGQPYQPYEAEVTNSPISNKRTVIRKEQPRA